MRHSWLVPLLALCVSACSGEAIDQGEDGLADDSLTGADPPTIIYGLVFEQNALAWGTAFDPLCTITFTDRDNNVVGVHPSTTSGQFCKADPSHAASNLEADSKLSIKLDSDENAAAKSDHGLNLTVADPAGAASNTYFIKLQPSQ